MQRLPSERLLTLIREGIPEDGERYLHWDKLRHLEPPSDLTHEEWWFLIKWGRQQLLRSIPLTDHDGEQFAYGVPDLVFRLLHYVDQRCSGEIAMPEVVIADEQARQHYLVNSLMEEAIRSSQLEGATTTRRVAKDLLRSGRKPQDRSERMILNNYRALQFMRDGMGKTLTPEAVLELHRILTEGTLDDPSAAGRLQTPDEERIAVLDSTDGTVIHAPPPAEELPNRLQALCDFANDESPERFVHPVVRAILLHFWLAYDHPFEDGNGRTARALFYWYMRTRGYWLVEYLSISQILRKAPSKYSRAFLLTETDERDTTYFIVYQLDVIQRAVDELHAYLQRKVAEVRDVERLVKGSSDFNHRQLALLGNAVRVPGETYTFRSHAASHNVTHETARNDLLPLAEKGLLQRRRVGRRYIFTPSPRLSELLKEGH
ncbi:MAG: Fic family protein [Thermoleophilaceae bacterium]